MTLPTGSRSRARAAAFTLVEVTIVVFIMATMLALAVPTFIRSYKSSQFNSAAQSIVTLCQLARLKAAVHQRAVTLHVDLNQQSAWVSQSLVLSASETADGRGEETDVLHRKIDIPPAVRIIAAGVIDDSMKNQGEIAVQFYPNGTCDGASIVLQGQTKKQLINISLDPVTARAKPIEVKS